MKTIKASQAGVSAQYLSDDFGRGQCDAARRCRWTAFFHIHLWCPIAVLRDAACFSFVGAVQCADAVMPFAAFRKVHIALPLSGRTIVMHLDFLRNDEASNIDVLIGH